MVTRLSDIPRKKRMKYLEERRKHPGRADNLSTKNWIIQKAAQEGLLSKRDIKLMKPSKAAQGIKGIIAGQGMYDTAKIQRKALRQSITDSRRTAYKNAMTGQKIRVQKTNLNPTSMRPQQALTTSRQAEKRQNIQRTMSEQQITNQINLMLENRDYLESTLNNPNTNKTLKAIATTIDTELKRTKLEKFKNTQDQLYKYTTEKISGGKENDRNNTGNTGSVSYIDKQGNALYDTRIKVRDEKGNVMINPPNKWYENPTARWTVRKLKFKDAKRAIEADSHGLRTLIIKDGKPETIDVQATKEGDKKSIYYKTSGLFADKKYHGGRIALADQAEAWNQYAKKEKGIRKKTIGYGATALTSALGITISPEMLIAPAYAPYFGTTGLTTTNITPKALMKGRQFIPEMDRLAFLTKTAPRATRFQAGMQKAVKWAIPKDPLQYTFEKDMKRLLTTKEGLAELKANPAIHIGQQLPYGYHMARSHAGKILPGIYEGKPQAYDPMSVPKEYRQQYKDMHYAATFFKGKPTEIQRLNIQRIKAIQGNKRTQSIFYKALKKAEGIVGGTLGIETAGIKLKRTPRDIDFYAENPMKAMKEFEKELRSGGVRYQTKDNAIIIDGQKAIEFVPMHTAEGNIASVSRRGLKWNTMTTPDGIKVLNPYILIKRKLYGGFEPGKGRPMERYSKDIPAFEQSAIQQLTKRKEKSRTDIGRYRTGRRISYIEPYKRLQNVETMNPVQYMYLTQKGGIPINTRPSFLTAGIKHTKLYTDFPKMLKSKKAQTIILNDGQKISIPEEMVKRHGIRNLKKSKFLMEEARIEKEAKKERRKLLGLDKRTKRRTKERTAKKTIKKKRSETTKEIYNKYYTKYRTPEPYHYRPYSYTTRYPADGHTLRYSPTRTNYKTDITTKYEPTYTTAKARGYQKGRYKRTPPTTYKTPYTTRYATTTTPRKRSFLTTYQRMPIPTETRPKRRQQQKTKSSVTGYQPVYFDNIGNVKLGLKYQTEKDAIVDAARITDLTEAYKFLVKETEADPNELRKARPYQKLYKFRKYKDTYIEKRYNRFDTKRESKGHFNIMPIIFGRASS